jgi:two-component system invasion response regulator UvrY
MIRVFIVDDHAVVRQGLKRILDESTGLEFAGEARSGDEALHLCHMFKWDIMLLDISMPDKSGDEVLQGILAQNKDAKILILSMHEEDQHAVRLMKSGAAGYLTKDATPDQMIDAIRRVGAGKKYISPTLAELLLQEVGADASQPLHSTLSNREFQVLKMLGSGKTVSEVAAQLSLSVKTISTYRTHILEKMHLKNNAELTVYVINNGLLNQ